MGKGIVEMRMRSHLTLDQMMKNSEIYAILMEADHKLFQLGLSPRRIVDIFHHHSEDIYTRMCIDDVNKEDK